MTGKFLLMKFSVPNVLIIIAGIGQMFTAIIYPYIRHVVFLTGIMILKNLNP
jgi:hypothetical protein